MKSLEYAMENIGIKPARYDKKGPMYLRSQLIDVVIKETQLGIHTPKREKTMADNIDCASDEIKSATAKFEKVFSRMVEVENAASAEAKKVSGNIRKAADDLASGLLKVQKTADFASLERHVSLLERAASALTVLADLDKDGRLEKLIKSMK